jgi:hypothetical protein
VANWEKSRSGLTWSTRMSSKGIKDLSARKPQNKTINALEENMGVFIISYREKANSLLKNHKDIKKIGKVNSKTQKLLHGKIL